MQTHHSTLVRKVSEVAAFVPLEQETRSHLATGPAAHLLGRKPQTLRGWACLENGPIRPVRVNGRLAWPVSRIKELLGLEVAGTTQR